MEPKVPVLIVFVQMSFLVWNKIKIKKIISKAQKRYKRKAFFIFLYKIALVRIKPIFHTNLRKCAKIFF